MFAQERHREILDLVLQKQRLTVAEVESALGTSPATTRRDLAEMEKRGLIVRVHGGVLHPDALRGEASFKKRHQEAMREKEAIATAAAALVEDGASVYIDAGTTCFEVAKLLLPRPDLTLYTNSLPLINAARRGGAKVVCIGGELRDVSAALVGDIALMWLGQLRFDLAFIGASGLSAAEGATATALSEASVKRQAIGRSTRPVLVAASHKWELPRAVQFAPWDAFSVWVTDAGIGQKSRAKDRPKQLELIIAGKERN